MSCLRGWKKPVNFQAESSRGMKRCRLQLWLPPRIHTKKQAPRKWWVLHENLAFSAEKSTLTAADTQPSCFYIDKPQLTLGFIRKTFFKKWQPQKPQSIYLLSRHKRALCQAHHHNRSASRVTSETQIISYMSLTNTVGHRHTHSLMLLG